MTSVGPGKNIGSASISVTADTSGFLTDLNSNLRRALSQAENTVQRAGRSIRDSLRNSFRQASAEARGIRAPDVDTSAAVRSINRVPEAMQDAARRTRTAGGEFRGLFSDVEGQADRASSRIGAAFRRISDTSREIGVEVASNIATSLTSAAGRLVTFGIQSAASLEQTQVAFTGLLGSSQQAEAFITRLQKFAAATPFEFPQLTTATQRLISLGQTGDQAIATLTSIGNAAAAVGVGGDAIEGVVTALAQIQAKGKLSAEELNQIAERLPNLDRGDIFDRLAAAMDKPRSEIQKLSDEGLIPADVAIKAITDSMNNVPGAAGAMARQAQTLNGLFSTFKDTLRTTLVTGLQPIIPALKSGLADAVPVIQTAIGSIGPAFARLARQIIPFLLEIARVFGPVVGRVLNAFGDALSRLLPVLIPAAHAIADFVDEALPLVEVLGDLAAIFIEQFTPVLRDLAPLVGEVAHQFSRVLFGPLQQVRGVIANLIGDFLGLGPATSAVTTFGSQLQPVIQRITDLVKVVGDFVVANQSKLLPVLRNLGIAFFGLRTINQVIGPITQSLIGIGQSSASLREAGTNVGFLGRNVGKLGGFAGNLGAMLRTLGQIAPFAAVAAIGLFQLAQHNDALRSSLDRVRDSLSQAFQRVAPAVQRAVEQMLPSIIQLVQELTALAIQVLPILADAFSNLIPVISTLISTGFRILGPLVSLVARNFLLLAPAIAAVGVAVAGIRLSGFIGDLRNGNRELGLFGSALRTGITAISAIGQAVLGGIGDFRTFFQVLRAENVGPFRAAMGAASESITGVGSSALGAVGGLGALNIAFLAAIPLVIGLGIAFQKAAENRRNQAELERTLQQAIENTNTKVRESIAEWTHQRLVSKGRIDDLGELGIAENTYSDAVAGSTDAQRQARVAVAAYLRTQTDLKDIHGQNKALNDQLIDSYIRTGRTVDDNAAKSVRLQAIISELPDHLERTINDLAKEERQFRESARTELDLVASGKDRAAQIARTALEQAKLNPETFNYANALDQVHQAQQGVVTTDTLQNIKDLQGSWDAASAAADAYQQSLKGVTNAQGQVVTSGQELVQVQNASADAQQQLNARIKANSDEHTKNADALNRNTEAGNKNEDAILQLVQARQQENGALLQRDVAQRGLTAGLQQGILRENQLRQQVVQAAKDMGLSDTAAQQYANTLIGTPKDITTRFQQIGAELVKQQMEDLARRADALTEKGQIRMDIQALIDTGQLDKADAILDNIARLRVIEMQPNPDPKAVAATLQKLDTLGVSREAVIEAVPEAASVSNTTAVLDNSANPGGNPRTAHMTGQANTGASTSALNQSANPGGRPRIAGITGHANTVTATRELDAAAHDRQAKLHGLAETTAAEAAIDDAARDRLVNLILKPSLPPQVFHVSGTLNLGRFASGGGVMPGVPIWVGERGAELFVPSAPGAIVPHNRSLAIERAVRAGVMSAGSAQGGTGTATLTAPVVFNTTVNMGGVADVATAERAGRAFAASAERALLRRGVITRVRTGG